MEARVSLRLTPWVGETQGHQPSGMKLDLGAWSSETQGTGHSTAYRAVRKGALSEPGKKKQLYHQVHFSNEVQSSVMSPPSSGFS